MTISLVPPQEPVEVAPNAPSRCVRGREVVLRFRDRRTNKVWMASVVCPARWTRIQLLAYARCCHPNETVRIENWLPEGQPDHPWETRLWVVNPSEWFAR